MVKPQTLKGLIGQYLNLQIKWQKQEFKALVDSKIIRNHMSLKAIERLRLFYRQKRDLYPLVTISGDLILYRDGIIYLETGLVKLEIKRRNIIISFNVLLLGKNKTVLGIPFLQKYNPKID